MNIVHQIVPRDACTQQAVVYLTMHACVPQTVLYLTMHEVHQAVDHLTMHTVYQAGLCLTMQVRINQLSISQCILSLK